MDESQKYDDIVSHISHVSYESTQRATLAWFRCDSHTEVNVACPHALIALTAYTRHDIHPQSKGHKSVAYIDFRKLGGECIIHLKRVPHQRQLVRIKSPFAL